jgi:hypothetical protein
MYACRNIGNLPLLDGHSLDISWHHLVVQRTTDRAGITCTSNTSHGEMKQTALKRDEEQVQAIVNHLNETMTDPFDIEAHPPCLMNISTGMHVTCFQF